MSDAKVQITLKADGSQVRDQLRLIDKEIDNLGRKGGRAGSSSASNDTRNGKGSGKQDSLSEREREQLIKEMTLIRKELQRLNKDGLKTASGGSTGGSSNTQSGVSLPSGSGAGTGTGNSVGSGNNASNALGKLGTVLAVASAVTKALSTLNQYSKSAASAESQAYQTYGSSRYYSNYYDAKENAYQLGVKYGYSSTDTMSANQAYMSSGGGWQNESRNNLAMDSILGIAKYTGIDSTSMASAAGKSAGMGTSATEFTTLLANSITEANMTGRESEQLEVLENIEDLLHQTNVTVSENQTADLLSVYNALVSGNENLKGSAGYEAVADVNSAYTSGNTKLMKALGYGSEYTGLEGLQEVYLKMSEGATTENLDKTMDYIVNTLGVTDEAYVKQLLGDMWGGLGPDNIQTVNSYLEDYYNYDESTGTWTNHTGDAAALTDESTASEYISEGEENYESAKVSTQEQATVNLTEAEEDLGNITNELTKGFKELYNSLPSFARTGASAAGVVAGAVGTGAAVKGGTSILSKLFGTGTAAAGEGAAAGAGEAAAASTTGAAASAAGETAAAAGAGATAETAAAAGGAITAGEAAAGTGLFAAALLALGIGYRKTDAKAKQDEADTQKENDIYNKDVDLQASRNAYAGSDEGTTYIQLLQDALSDGKLTSEELKDNNLSWDKVQSIMKGLYGDDFNSSGISFLSNSGDTENFLSQDQIDMLVQANSEDFNDLKTSSLDEMEAQLEEIEKNTESKQNNSFQTGVQNLLNATSLSGSKLGTWISNLFGISTPTSHAVGADYIPYDNYNALLHKGEMVLSAADARDLREGSYGSSESSSVDLNINLTGSVSGMTQENQNLIVSAVLNQMSNTTNSVKLNSLLKKSYQRVQTGS